MCNNAIIHVYYVKAQLQASLKENCENDQSCFTACDIINQILLRVQTLAAF